MTGSMMSIKRHLIGFFATIQISSHGAISRIGLSKETDSIGSVAKLDPENPH